MKDEMKTDLEKLLKMFQEDLDLNNEELVEVKKEIDALKQFIVTDDVESIEVFRVTCDLITLRFKRKKTKAFENKIMQEVLNLALKYGGKIIKKKLGGLL